MKLLKQISLGLLAILALTVGQGSAASELPRIKDPIPEQPVAEALSAFSRQTGLQIVYMSRVADGLRSTAVPAGLVMDEALRQLLSTTGLSFEFLNERTVTIRIANSGSPTAARAGEQTQTGRPEIDERLRLTENQVMRKVQNAGEQVSNSTSDYQSAAKNEPKRKDESEVVVTGTHIRGLKDSPTPSITISRQEIEETGYQTVQEVLESLPQNFADISSDGGLSRNGASTLALTNGAARISGVNLRGLGVESTLTLVNGMRRAGSLDGRAVDISIIPLSIIERVEVVTGGRSAVYGSDAVAGVVNIVTRNQFDGAETNVSYGATDSGEGERLQASQIFGATFGRGSIVAAYDYMEEQAFDLVEAGLANTAFSGDTLFPLRRDSQADSTRHAVSLFGKFSATDRLELHADALYAHRETGQSSADLRVGTNTANSSQGDYKSEQYSALAGMQLDLNNKHTLSVSTSLSQLDDRNSGSQILYFGSPPIQFFGAFARHEQAHISGASAIVDGPLFQIGDIASRMAVGVDVRRETYELTNSAGAFKDSARTIRAAFAELVMPFASGEGRTGLRQLDLSLAGRYDDYSDFGDTFNPQAGIVWKLTDQFGVRGAYSTAFRAPSLFSLGSSVFVILGNLNNPTGGTRPTLIAGGENPNLQPEDAKTWSVSVDYNPASWATMSVSYFDVDYRDRIDTPAPAFADQLLILSRASLYPADVLITSPTAAQADALVTADSDGFLSNSTGTAFNPATQSVLTVFPNLVLFDNRTKNIAVETARGLDLITRADIATKIGQISFGVNATYTLDHERRLTVTSPALDRLNEVGKSTDFRTRATMGWRNRALGASLSVNYVDEYSNPFTTPASTMSSWTTVDLSLRFEGSALSPDKKWFDGVRASLSAINLLDKSPPFLLGSASGINYDPTNASPFGRYFTLQATKRW